MTSEPDLVALCADIKLAIPRIAQHSSQTPVLRIQALDQLIDGEVLLKAECLQATGSFKIRGCAECDVRYHRARRYQCGCRFFIREPRYWCGLRRALCWNRRDNRAAQ